MIKGFLQFSSLTLVSRILGLLRDWLFAFVFGASAGLDAFLIAFKIPNFFRRIFAEGAVSQALLPVLVECRKDQPDYYQAYTDGLFTRLVSCLVLFSSLGVIAAPLWVLLFAPGYADNPEQWALTSLLLRFTFPYILFISVIAFIVTILNSTNRFMMGALLPVILNGVLIVASSVFSSSFAQPELALAIGVFIAGILQLVLIVLFARNKGIRLSLRWHLSEPIKPYISKFLKIFLPALFSVSVTQINLIVDMLLASSLPAGSITWLYLSQRLMELPNGVIIVALSTVALTPFSELVAEHRWQDYYRRVNQSLELGLALTLPAVIGLVICASPIMLILFEYGQFSSTDRLQSAYSLQAYAIGLIGVVVMRICAAACFANQDSRSTLHAAILGMLVNVLLSIALIRFYQHIGLALATSIAAWINGLLVYLFMLRKQRLNSDYRWPHLSKILIANALLTLILLLCQSTLSEWWYVQPRLYQAVSLIGLFISLGSIYAYWIWSLKLPLLSNR